MSTQRNTKNKTYAISLSDAYLDFILSRKAKLVSENMLIIYNYTTGKFIPWLEKSGVTTPKEITSRYIRTFISEISQTGISDNTIALYARSIKTLVRFFYAEKYSPELITFEMPKVEKKKLSFLQPEQLPIVLNSCDSARDKAIILFMIDTGLRRAELCNLNWGDVNLNSGTIIVRRGKGKKARSVGIGNKTRRTLLAYGRHYKREDNDPVFTTYSGKRLSPEGLRSFIVA